MSALHKNVPVFSHGFDGIVKKASEIMAAAEAIYRARQSRAVTRQLLAHDDRLLNDIGVSRSDIDRALMVDWNEDPAVALAQIRQRRLQAERQGLVRRRAQ